MKTLIADDELVSRKKMEKIMEAFGECKTVETGKAAVAAFSESLKNGEPFDLVTLDIMMPDMDGLRALVEIRGPSISRRTFPTLISLDGIARK